jgi:hypothetical protein
LFSWLVQQDYFKELTEIDIRNVLYAENMKAIEQSVLPFGIVDDGRPLYELEEDTGFF